VLAAVVGVIVLAALVTVLVASHHPAELEPGSPEAAVQDYVDAVLDRDSEVALRMLAPGSDCEVEDFDNAYVPEDVYMSLREVEVSGSTARVDVSVTDGSGGMIPTEWTEERTFRLQRAGDDWLITGTPWPLFECGVMVK